MTLTPGDVVELDLGSPAGSEAGLLRQAVVITADRILRGGPNAVQVVPLTRTIRPSGAEVLIGPDRANGLDAPSAAQCQHVRSVSIGRVRVSTGHVGRWCWVSCGECWRCCSTFECPFAQQLVQGRVDSDDAETSSRGYGHKHDTD